MPISNIYRDRRGELERPAVSEKRSRSWWGERTDTVPLRYKHYVNASMFYGRIARAGLTGLWKSFLWTAAGHGITGWLGRGWSYSAGLMHGADNAYRHRHAHTHENARTSGCRTARIKRDESARVVGFTCRNGLSSGRERENEKVEKTGRETIPSVLCSRTVFFFFLSFFFLLLFFIGYHILCCGRRLRKRWRPVSTWTVYLYRVVIIRTRTVRSSAHRRHNEHQFRHDIATKPPRVDSRSALTGKRLDHGNPYERISTRLKSDRK